MPLERRVQPRTYQRERVGTRTRQQPYRLASSLRERSSQEVTLAPSSPGRHAPVRAPFQPLSKRYVRCACTTYDEPMQTDDVRSDIMLEDEAQETQRLFPEQRPQTNPNQNSWHSESPLLRSGAHRSAESYVDSIQPDPSANSSDTSARSELSSMIPNVVPMSTQSDLSHSLAFVTNSNRPASDAVQSAHTQLRDGQHSYNAVEVDQLTNHERSSSYRGVDSMCASASLRSCRRAMSELPPATAQARQVANRVIRHAHHNKTPDELALWCPDCKHLPIVPVTGQCGHTRCTKCIQENGKCPCGAQAPRILHVNTLIQGIVRKMLPAESTSREGEQTQSGRKSGREMLPGVRPSLRRSGARPSRLDLPAPHALLSTQTRFALARGLMSAGAHRDAAPHLARVAASRDPLARVARAMLAQSITVLSGGLDARRLTRVLQAGVRAQAAAAWLRARDLECVLCYHAYCAPVTTPCGHTYCRTCIERSMDYRKSCALCLRSLEDFDLAATKETVFVCAALESIDALNPPPPADPDVIPIFVCTVAYPAIPCPLFIFDPRYWLMIRRVLESGSRKFGMVAYERDRCYSDYGTVLEVCDCVHLEDGRSILSTVGVSRFRVIERDVRDGCDVARIQPLTDISPTEELVIWELRLLATQVSYKALLWLNSMSAAVRSEIEAAFGQLPAFDQRQEDWWRSPDGPAWLWWLVAILPLRSTIKILILSTKNLLKRMMAVSRTLDAIDQVAISATATSECELRSALSTAEEWLERSD